MTVSEPTVTTTQRGSTTTPGRSRRLGPGRGRPLPGIVSVLAGVLIWQLLSMRLPPLFLPSPMATLQSSVELWRDGTLVQAIIASLGRISLGWGCGLIVGIPVGILMGHFRLVRR